jgi:RHS repeat-associated protein
MSLANASSGTYYAYVIVDTLTEVSQGGATSNDGQLNAGIAFTVTAATLAAAPPAPQNLNVASGNTTASLNWNPPSSNGGAAISGYRVYRGTSSGNTSLLTTGGCANLGVVLSCSDSGLTNGQIYYYVVYAVNSAGQGAASTPAPASPAAVVLSLNGYVFDVNSGNGIPNVQVSAGGSSATSGSDGRFVLTNLTNSIVTVQAAVNGYGKRSIDGVNPATSSQLIINLTPETVACAAGEVSGEVRETARGFLLPGATVKLSSGASTLASSLDGKYKFTNVAPGPVRLIVSVEGFEDYYQPLNICGNAVVNPGLTKRNATFGSSGPISLSVDPVNTATGNYIYQHTDLSIPGKGMAFSFERSYNSQAASDVSAASGPFGYGWTHSYNTYLTVSGSTVTVTLGDGKTETYTSNGSGGYTAQYGVFDTLVNNGNGTYSLKKKDLTTYNFNASNRLASIVDKNGNSIVLTYSGSRLTRITDTAGRNIDLGYDSNNFIVSIMDPMTRAVQFTYDNSGNLVTARDAKGNVTTFAYDANHQITSITDPRGNVFVTNVYDASKRVVNSQRDAKQGQTIFVYDPANRRTTLTDAMGNVTVDYFDEKLRVVRQQDANGNSVHYTYDAAGNRASVTDKNGNLTQYSYDANGNVTGKTDALNRSSTVTYDANNNPLTRTDALGSLTQFAYDAKGNLLSVTDALNNTARNTYNGAGQVLTTTDARGATTTNTYDYQGNLAQVSDALANGTYFTYDAVGRRLSRRDALNRLTSIAYDNNDNLLSTTDANLNTATANYDGNNNRINAKDKRGYVTAYAYDVKDLLTTTTDPLTKTVVTSYDALDRKTAVKDKNGNSTSFGYDAAGNLISTTDALNQVTQIAVDAQGNRLTVTDPLGHVSRYAYDALNRQVTAADALANQTQTTYDELGRVARVTNAKNQTTTFTYDKIGRLTQVLDANNGTVKYGYDANGNRTSMIDPNGNLTTYAYDTLNRLIAKAEPLGTTRYQYDAVGNRNQVTQPNGAITRYTYDNLDRLQSVRYADNSTVAFSYDVDGNRTGMSDSLGNSSTQYDALGRMTAATDPFNQTVSYGYDAQGNRTSLTYPGNKTAIYAFDALNRMTSVTDWLSNRTSYAYDAAGRLVSSTLPNGVTSANGFDSANRLTSLSHARGNSSIANYAYTLDEIGNHKQVTQTEPLPQVVTPGTASYMVDSENRLTAISGVANTFDLNGNLTAKGSNSYAYDYEDRLKQSTLGGVTSQYQYDGLGHRFVKTSAGAPMRYVLDLNGALSKVLMETNVAGGAYAYYVYGLGLVSRISATGSPSYYHFDSRGSTVALTDAAGTVTEKYTYDPFGNVVNSAGIDKYVYDVYGNSVNSAGTTPNPFKYVGQYGVMDEGNGLHYIRARFYDAQIGRFLNKDPKLGNDSDGQSLNRYVYAGNNPIRFVDVSGYTKLEVTPKAKAECGFGKIFNIFDSSFDGCNSVQVEQKMLVFEWAERQLLFTDATLGLLGSGAGCATGSVLSCGKSVKAAAEMFATGYNLVKGTNYETSMFKLALGEKVGSAFEGAEDILDLVTGAYGVGGSAANSLGISSRGRSIAPGFARQADLSVVKELINFVNDGWSFTRK